MTSAAAKPVITFSEVGKSYGANKALDGISFSMSAGEIVGLLGPNGAGKSTLFQIASGLFAPDTGAVAVFGRDYPSASSEILRRLGVVFQSRSVDLDMSARANLRFHGQLFGLSGKLLAQRIDDVAGFLDIADLLDKQVRTLSGGNQRRVEIARALLNEPQLLLMDEPSVGLDTTARRALVEHVRRIRDARGTSILWATHLVDEVEDADRIVLINKSRVTHQGTPSEIIAAAGAKDLSEAYVALTGGNRPAEF
ncbi:ATP-binding cassette domain-containing protein [Devosia sp.]|uniref:ATP-binding cassette domain-containing protein n=1 Tax=Devosia sp. TaxID=1871048 RepID=UPI001AC0128F|nr:ATP-binding cassette domain-containing protein [Devosia sp.]MBN9332613.1 ATP-binding cassette domain-containing protein [Devosia sp.]